MPHWRTWSAFFLASGHSSAVPSALLVDIRQVTTSDFGNGKHAQKTHYIEAVKLAATSDTKSGHKYGVRSGQARSDRKPKSNTKNAGADQVYITPRMLQTHFCLVLCNSETTNRMRGEFSDAATAAAGGASRR